MQVGLRRLLVAPFIVFLLGIAFCFSSIQEAAASPAANYSGTTWLITTYDAGFKVNEVSYHFTVKKGKAGRPVIGQLLRITPYPDDLSPQSAEIKGTFDGKEVSLKIPINYGKMKPISAKGVIDTTNNTVTGKLYSDSEDRFCKFDGKLIEKPKAR